jgi:hypothetical protein
VSDARDREARPAFTTKTLSGRSTALVARSFGWLHVGADDAAGRPLASRAVHPSPLDRPALCRETLEVGAGCSNRGRPDLRGGRPAMCIPTATQGQIEKYCARTSMLDVGKARASGPTAEARGRCRLDPKRTCKMPLILSGHLPRRGNRIVDFMGLDPNLLKNGQRLFWHDVHTRGANLHEPIDQPPRFHRLLFRIITMHPTVALPFAEATKTIRLCCAGDCHMIARRAAPSAAPQPSGPSNALIVRAAIKPDSDPDSTGCSARAERQCALGRCSCALKRRHILCDRH